MRGLEELLGPARSRVEAVIAKTGREVPRAGLAGALIYGFSREFGDEPSSELIDGVVLLAEIGNRVSVEGRSGDWKALLQSTHRGKLSELLHRARAQRQPEFEELLQRLRPTTPLRAVPEGVIFARGCLAVAAVAAKIPPELHRRLDPVATWFGLSLESEISEECWTGSWGTERPRIPALMGLQEEVGGLPFSPFLDALCRVSIKPMPRAFEVWRPQEVGPQPTVGGDEYGLDALLTGPPVLVSAARYVSLQGGKRLRPRLVRATAAAAGQEAHHEATVEWLHLLSLVLDDVLDEAETRRGRVALHRLTDVPFAVSVAGWLAARIAEDTHDTWVGEELSRAAETLLWGEAEEFRRLGEWDLSGSSYRQIIAAKTGSLFELAATLGAHGESRFGTFGLHLGIAFQLIDDLLDYVGEETELGKVPGVDFRTKKITLPLILLHQKLPPDERHQLEGLLGSDALEWVLPRLRTHGVVEAVEAQANEEIERGFAALRPHERTAALRALARQAVERVS